MSTGKYKGNVMYRAMSGLNLVERPFMLIISLYYIFPLHYIYFCSVTCRVIFLNLFFDHIHYLLRINLRSLRCPSEVIKKARGANEYKQNFNE